MSRSLTNKFSLSYAIEASLGVAGTSWFLLEPNTISTFGATITTVPRDPISKTRQRKKGAVTDLDSAVEIEADLTMSHLTDFIEAFFFVTAVNADMVFNPSAVTGTGYTVPAITAAQSPKLETYTLMFARGFTTAANNGLKLVNADIATSATEITVTGLTVEASPPANAELEYAGVRAATSDLAITVTSGVATLVSSATLNFTVLGLTVGQFIHVGGLLTANQFSAGAGFGRITSITATTLLLDKLDSTIATDPGTGDTVDLLFGRFMRNVDVDDSEFLERTFTFEGAFADLDSVGTDEFEYAKGNFCNTMAFNLPLTDKATITFGFVGTDTDVPTTTRKTGASTAKSPNKTAAFNTSSDIARLRITNVDETGLTTDFKSLTLTINNNVTPEKVLATLGAKFINTGNFDIDIEAQLLFTEGDVVAAIRNNTTVTMDFQVNNDDGAIYFDIPSMTLGGGGKDFPVDESILINTTAQAFEDTTLLTSLGASLFAVVP